jgi:hypothetical protein
LIGNRADQLKRIWMSGLDRQHLPITLLGIGEPSRLMIFEPQF